MREPPRVRAGQLALERGFVNIGRDNEVGRNADLRKQTQSARAGRGQDQGRTRDGQWPGSLRYLNRNVMRPLLRS